MKEETQYSFPFFRLIQLISQNHCSIFSTENKLNVIFDSYKSERMVTYVKCAWLIIVWCNTKRKEKCADKKKSDA